MFPLLSRAAVSAPRLPVLAALSGGGAPGAPRAAAAAAAARARAGAARGARLRSTAPPVMRNEEVPRVALVLTAGGLVPFLWLTAQHAPVGDNATPPAGDALLAAAAAAAGAPGALAWAQLRDQRGVRAALIGYASCILSFVGAVHWGVAMVAPPAPGAGLGPRALYVASVLPALVGAGACVASARAGHATVAPHFALAGAFAGVYLLDEALLLQKAVPAWYTHVRTPVTFAVATCLTVAGYGGRELSALDRMRAE